MRGKGPVLCKASREKMLLDEAEHGSRGYDSSQEHFFEV